MEDKYQLSIFIFRRDLRLFDNTALIQAQLRSNQVIPIFIFDPRLIEKNNLNTNAVQFMMKSLEDVQEQLEERSTQLYYFKGLPHDVIKNLIDILPIEAVFSNIDYTPFSKHRDFQISNICEQNNIDFIQSSDYALSPLEGILTSSNSHYKVFTPFFKKVHQLKVRKPKPLENNNFFQAEINLKDDTYSKKHRSSDNTNLILTGGRTEGMQLLSEIKSLDNYEKLRDYPSVDGTTKLSAHHRFGTISIRETYHTVKKYFSKNHPLIRQLYWRDFYYYLAIHYPHVFNTSFYRKYSNIKWRNNSEHFKQWCSGRTGFPIIDAGMRELNKTGYMHNRVRMLTASFLVKDLHINWRWGERYYAEKLVDYDPSVNNGNWQWAASTGADAQPYFRIFNPWTQQKKYDKECVYIKTHVPELRELTSKEIHQLEIKKPSGLNYPSPIVEHKKSAEIAKDLFKVVV